MTLQPPSFASRALAAVGALLLAGATLAATPSTAPARPSAKPSAKPSTKPSIKPAAKAPAKPAGRAQPSPTRQQAASTAQGLALATATVEALSAGQLGVAAQVLTGAADCEFEQRVTVLPLHGVPGHFTVSHKGRHYRMLPRETATGAVRLEDPGQGIVWLQIPAKSMLMNARRGQRMIDNCLHADQRAAMAAAAVAAGAEMSPGLGIVPGAAVQVDTAASR